MTYKYALMPLLIAHAFAYAADDAAENKAPAQTGAVLQEVKVTGQAQRSFSSASHGELRDRVNLGLLGRQNAFTAPVNVVNYDEKIIADKEPRTLVDVIAKTDASVMSFGGETNTLQGLYVRNLQLDARQFSLNGLAGLYSTYASPTAGVGSAQLIKGANSATVGMDAEGSVSSAVNIETKKATDEPINRVSMAWFSDNRLQPTFDFGRRFGSNKEWGVRVNGKYRQGDTPRNGFSEESTELALNTDYRGERLKAALDLWYNKRNTDGGRARVQDMQTLTFNMPKAPDGKTNLVPSWQGQDTSDKTVALTFEYDADNITYSGGIGHMESTYRGVFTQLTMLNEQGDYRSAAARRYDYAIRNTSANFKARGEFDTGAVSHNWSVGFDAVKRERDFDRSATAGAFTSNIYNPEFPDAPAFGALSQNTDESYFTPSLAIADTLGFWENRLRLTAGARLQYIKQKNERTGSKYSEHALNPMLTAVWTANPGLVFYGNYMQDLEPGEIVDDTNAVNDGDTLKPAKSKQIELGVRKNWGDIVTTASVYQITRPSAYLNSSNIYGYNGKERNRGLELNAYANLLNKTLRPSLGVSFMRAELQNYQAWGSDAIINGNQQVTSPRIIAKAGVEWDTSFAEGLTLNAGLQHYGKSFQNPENTYTLPSYTTYDFGARYQTKMGGNKLTVSGAVENAFNKHYWQIQRGRSTRSFAVVGMPRTLWLKAELAF